MYTSKSLKNYADTKKPTYKHALLIIPVESD